MRFNEITRIIGKKVILVPYKKEHVLKHHELMNIYGMQDYTRSQPVSLKEEYLTQEYLRRDNYTCMFIILNKEMYDTNSNEIDAMVGDTHLRIDYDRRYKAEAEIMIAEESNNGQGFGWEAMIIMLRYGIEKLKVTWYVVRISRKNEKSMQMFTKLGFEVVGRCVGYKDVVLSKKLDNEWLEFLTSETPDFIITKDC